MADVRVILCFLAFLFLDNPIALQILTAKTFEHWVATELEGFQYRFHAPPTPTGNPALSRKQAAIQAFKKRRGMSS